MPERLLSKESIAALLDVGVRHIWYLSAANELGKPIYVGRKKATRWRASAVTAFIKRRERRPRMSKEVST